ncbi:MAG TPA: glycosyltransferase family 1 protein [Mycobacteriales bacterium]|nr:glycosyltransferase family 1 protein [Mycobacteriales bacterium]
MKVALDLTPTLSGVTGVARYAARLAEALPGQGVEVGGFAVGRGPGAAPPGTRRLRVPLRIVQPMWRSVGRPRAETLAGGADVVHSLDLALPPTRRPLVATIHDLAALDRPDLHPAGAADQLRRRLDSLASAAAVLAVSHATAAALKRYGVPADRVSVTPQAPTLSYDEVVAPDVSGPFLLAVGEITARKDYPTLIRALARPEAADLQLVMAGPMGFRGEEVSRLIEQLGLTGRVQLLGRVSDARLAGLYRCATALCFPSIIEGYGLPLVEAMAEGLPIVASDIDVSREVAGDAARYFPVGDDHAFAQALADVAGDPQLRADLGSVGRARSAELTWQRTAALTAAAYRAVA